MSRLSIVYYGDPLLRKKCEPIQEVNEEIRQFAQDMLETMDSSDGIGLAAPQVGKSLRLFVCRFYDLQPDGHFNISAASYVFINPKITLLDRNKEIHDEGCLSMPGFQVPVPRPLKVSIEALDIEGKPFQLEQEGYNARVLLHENDHLNGVLHIDRTDEEHRKKVEPLLRAIKQQHKRESHK